MIGEFLATPVALDQDSVWVRKGEPPFVYSDGLQVERYLEHVFASAVDLSSTSVELERWIKDWPTAYHLSRARTQLLEAFPFDRSACALEVGCGCGAITRLLGERLGKVVAVEGSHARARLARMRTKDLDGVSIVCSRYEELEFERRFDLIFCIGVLEYAGRFVQSEAPYDEILRRFSELLTDDGLLILAIENQLGLKYFCSSAEDHSHVMFDGIEGYPRDPSGARTFGRSELESHLREHFSSVEFYYPFPDYKMPSCVISDRLLEATSVAGLIGSFDASERGNPSRGPLFDERLSWYEIERNRLIPHFAPSFLAIAGKAGMEAIRPAWLGAMYSNQRKPEFSTRTFIFTGSDGPLLTRKERTADTPTASQGLLRHQEWQGKWIAGESLQIQMARSARKADGTLAEIMAPARPWFEKLIGPSGLPDKRHLVKGDRLDSIWRNCFIVDQECLFIDQEWSWARELPLSLIIARALYYFFRELTRYRDLSSAIRGQRVGTLIRSGSRQYGVIISFVDLYRFARFEERLLLTTSSGKSAAWKDRLFEFVGIWIMLFRRVDPVQSRWRLRRIASHLRKTVLRPRTGPVASHGLRHGAGVHTPDGQKPKMG